MLIGVPLLDACRSLVQILREPVNASRPYVNSLMAGVTGKGNRLVGLCQSSFLRGERTFIRGESISPVGQLLIGMI